MVFQDYALFPHLSVERNVGFGLGAMPAAARSARVDELLATVAWGAWGRSFPTSCRAAAAARGPGPGRWRHARSWFCWTSLSNLDVDLRERLSVEVRRSSRRKA